MRNAERLREIARRQKGGGVNKWIVRFWGLVALLGLAGLIASSAWSHEGVAREHRDALLTIKGAGAG